MIYLPDRDEMQEIDRRTIEDKGIPGILLMEGAAIEVLHEINKRKGIILPNCLRCLIVVEGGNNGGDGLALARLLAQQGHLLVVDVQEAVVHPVAAEGAAIGALTLGDLVLVVAA